MELFMVGLVLSASLCFDIGVANVAVMQTSITRGIKPGISMGLGATTSDLIYAILSLVGLSLLLNNIYVRYILWIGGTLVLVYMTYLMLKDAFKKRSLNLEAENSKGKSSLYKDYLKGFTLTASSPTGFIWFATVGGSIISATINNQSKAEILYFFGGFLLFNLLWSLFLPIVVKKAEHLVGPKILNIFSFIAAIIFLYFAGHVFIDGYKNLLN
ncbi:LysE family translocator [Peribacillus sp. SCS-155]|uniref:LysE family translocator n=1 Tax=Peribacillus sedimenti TaxID=3115297 RepID=UPI003905BB3C